MQAAARRVTAQAVDGPADQQPGDLAQFRVGHAVAQPGQQRPAGNAVETVGDVAAGYPVPAGVSGRDHRFDRGAGTQPAPVGVRTRLQGRVYDRVQDVEGGAFDDPVGDRAEVQYPQSTAGLGDLDPVDWIRAPGPLAQCNGQ